MRVRNLPSLSHSSLFRTAFYRVVQSFVGNGTTLIVYFVSVLLISVLYIRSSAFQLLRELYPLWLPFCAPPAGHESGPIEEESDPDATNASSTNGSSPPPSGTRDFPPSGNKSPSVNNVGEDPGGERKCCSGLCCGRLGYVVE